MYDHDGETAVGVVSVISIEPDEPDVPFISTPSSLVIISAIRGNIIFCVEGFYEENIVADFRSVPCLFSDVMYVHDER